MMHITQANQSIRLEVFPTGRVNVARALGAGCAIAQPTVMVRKSAALAVGGYRLPFCNGAEDYDLWLRISEHHPVDNLPYTLTLYRIHSTSFTLTNAPEQAFAALVARCSYRRRIAGLPDPLEGKSTALTLDELNLLNLNEHEEGGFMPAIFTMLIKQQASPEKVLAWLNRAWQLRAHQRRGRLVRHVLAPGAFMLAKFGYTKASLVWFTRAFMTEPFSACWLFMRRRN